ncbi:putative methanogenesis regulatory protein FilR2 [uncultured archaeon]|nr:putative methanogenesis regulatory protein FilR2 [uncultured archaeon]
MVKTILVVDDNPDIAISVKGGLEQFHDKYTVISATSGEQCLRLLKKNQIPDLILLDIMMPGISGWETYYLIKENPSWKKIPVVFLTARADSMAKNAGQFLAEDYIEKPFNIEDLEKRIDTALQK